MPFSLPSRSFLRDLGARQAPLASRAPPLPGGLYNGARQDSESPNTLAPRCLTRSQCSHAPFSSHSPWRVLSRRSKSAPTPRSRTRSCKCPRSVACASTICASSHAGVVIAVYSAPKAGRARLPNTPSCSTPTGAGSTPRRDTPTATPATSGTRASAAMTRRAPRSVDTSARRYSSHSLCDSPEMRAGRR
jgi:hypothetical protein